MLSGRLALCLGCTCGGMEVSGREGSGLLARLFNTILVSGRMPEEWRGVLILLFKNKHDV